MNNYLLYFGLIHHKSIVYCRDWRSTFSFSLKMFLLVCFTSQLFLINLQASRLTPETYEFILVNLFHPLTFIAALILLVYLTLFCWYTVLAGKVTKSLIGST